MQQAEVAESNDGLSGRQGDRDVQRLPCLLVTAPDPAPDVGGVGRLDITHADDRAASRVVDRVAQRNRVSQRLVAVSALEHHDQHVVAPDADRGTTA